MAAVLADLNVAPAPAPARPGWQARLDLGFAARGGRSLLAARRHAGPLRVQRPFYPEGPAVCHVYLLHPPGGVVGGDELRMEIQAASGAHALVTTPAAGKFYRCDDAVGRVEQRIGVAADASVEWLPQETIVYAGARAEMLTRVDVAGGARFIGWETVCLGRPAGAAPFTAGDLRQRFEIWREGRPLWLERSHYDGASPTLASAWGLQGHAVTATLVCVGGDADLIGAIRAVVLPDADESFGVTRLRDVTVCRYLGPSAERARRCLIPAWWQMRWALLRRGPQRPRIWET
jgi:urease accessory protein